MRHIFLILLVVSFSTTTLADESFFSSGYEAYNPFRIVFNPEFSDAGLRTESHKILNRMNTFIISSQKLSEQCSQELSVRYGGIENLETAQRTYASTLQWTMLNELIPVIGETARITGMERSDFEQLVDNLVSATCSKNFSLMSFKKIKVLLLQSYNQDTKSPRLKKSLFFPDYLTEKEELNSSLERHLALYLRSFRAMCSWGGDVQDFRMLTPYLRDPLIAIDTIFKISGKGIDEFGHIINSEHKDRVTCVDTICRETSVEIFNGQFPRMIGSIGIEQDMKNLYCKHFSDLRYKTKEQDKIVLDWIKEIDSIDEQLEILNFQALLHRFPFILLAAGSYKEFVGNLKQVVEINWNHWANGSVDNLNAELMYEESVHLDFVTDSDDKDRVIEGNFSIDANIVLGEFDRAFGKLDKMVASIPLNFSKEFVQWSALELSMSHNIPALASRREQAMKLIKETLVADLGKGLSELKLPWGADKIAEMVADDLSVKFQKWADEGFQGKIWQGTLRGQITIPVNFHFGLFTLQLMRDRFQHGRRRY